MGQAAPDGAARADREMPDQGGRLGQERQTAADHGRELDRPLARHGSNPDVAGVLADVGEGRHPIQIDQGRRPVTHGRDVLKVQLLIEAILRSAAEGRAVQLPLSRIAGEGAERKRGG